MKKHCTPPSCSSVLSRRQKRTDFGGKEESNTHKEVGLMPHGNSGELFGEPTATSGR